MITLLMMILGSIISCGISYVVIRLWESGYLVRNPQIQYYTKRLINLIDNPNAPSEAYHKLEKDMKRDFKL